MRLYGKPNTKYWEISKFCAFGFPSADNSINIKKYTFYNMMVRGRAGDFFIQQNVLLFFFVLGQGVLCFNQIGATKKVIVISGTFKPST